MMSTFIKPDGVGRDTVPGCRRNARFSWLRFCRATVLGRVVFLVVVQASGGGYSPPAEQSGSEALHKDDKCFIAWATGYSALTRGHMDISNPIAGNASFGDPTNALSKATGDSSGVVSLGDGGSMTLTFDRPIANGPGFDFAVFENSFSDTFLEIGFVEVSSDGVNFHRFDAISVVQTNNQIGGFGSLDTTELHNFAGKYRQGYGTPFDLEELAGRPGLNVCAVTHVRIVDVIGCLQDAYSTYDSTGRKVNAPWPTPFASSGFDLDAVGVIHQSNWTPSTWSQFHGGAGHPGSYDGTVAAKRMRLLWSAGSGLNRNTQPAVSKDGQLIFAYGDTTNGNRGIIVAFSAANGVVAWATGVVSLVEYGSWSSPVYYNGYVYWAGSDAGTATIYKINAVNGSCSAEDGGWVTSVSGDIVNATPTIAEAGLFISTYGGFGPGMGRHYGVNVSNGTVLWNVRAGGQGQGAMAYDPDRKLLYQTVYTNSKHRLAAFDPQSGTIVWTAPWSIQFGAFQCGIASTSNRIYLQDFNFAGPSWLYTADPANGGALLASNALPQAGNSTPAVDPDGNVYAFGNWQGPGQTFSFDAAGNLRWTFLQGGGWTASPAWGDHLVFVGAQTHNTLYLLNDADGSIATHVPGSGPVSFGINAFYSIGTDGVLYAYLADDGGPYIFTGIHPETATNAIVVRHTRRTDLPNVRVHVESCTNLIEGGWTTNGIIQDWMVTPSESIRENFEALLPSTDRLFIRLRATW